jgi:hypothetical protein
MARHPAVVVRCLSLAVFLLWSPGGAGASTHDPCTHNRCVAGACEAVAVDPCPGSYACVFPEVGETVSLRSTTSAGALNIQIDQHIDDAPEGSITLTFSLTVPKDVTGQVLVSLNGTAHLTAPAATSLVVPAIPAGTHILTVRLADDDGVPYCSASAVVALRVFVRAQCTAHDQCRAAHRRSVRDGVLRLRALPVRRGGDDSVLQDERLVLAARARALRRPGARLRRSRRRRRRGVPGVPGTGPVHAARGVPDGAVVHRRRRVRLRLAGRLLRGPGGLRRRQLLHGRFVRGQRVRQRPLRGLLHRGQPVAAAGPSP